MTPGVQSHSDSNMRPGVRSHRRLCWLVVDCVHPRAAADDDRKQTARMSRQSAENHTADTTVRLVSRTETTFLIYAPTVHVCYNCTRFRYHLPVDGIQDAGKQPSVL